MFLQPRLVGEQIVEEHSYLAISGGGAYGAGVLAGWSKTGTRPQFTMVTGISTGALKAPSVPTSPGDFQAGK